MRLAFVLLLTCGCRQIFGLDPPTPLGDSGRVEDAPVDVAPDSEQMVCFSRPEVGFGACLAHAPTVAYTTSTPMTIDTDSSASCETLASQTQDMCVVAATSVTIGANVVATGSRPLVIFSTGTLELAATFEVASHASGTRGAGATPAICGMPESGTNGGGGAGGSFTTPGGDGGRGGQGGAGGTALAAVSVTAFRGGCPGGTTGVTAPTFGGGALALVASSLILDSNGALNASGAGGMPGVLSHGGYGGGSGGMILISAPVVAIGNNSQLFANGGGGGGGSSATAMGTVGHEAVTYNLAVQGGQGGNTGGSGGQGFPLNAGSGQNGGGGQAGGGGGGGGGGVVAIYTNSQLQGVRSSPMASINAY